MLIIFKQSNVKAILKHAWSCTFFAQFKLCSVSLMSDLMVGRGGSERTAPACAQREREFAHFTQILAVSSSSELMRLRGVKLGLRVPKIR